MTYSARLGAILLAAVAALLGLAPSSRAETVELRDGRAITGSVSTDGEGHIVVSTADGTEVLERAQVLRVIWDVDTDRGGERLTDDTPAVAGRADREPVSLAAASKGAAPPKALTVKQILALRDDLETAAKDDEASAVTLYLLQRLEGREANDRVAAMDEIAAAWPQSRESLRIVLTVGSDQARLDAARLLRARPLGDTADLCDRMLEDSSDAVRIQTLRAIHDKFMTKFEPRVRELLSGRAPWTVRQEAARTLERIGGLEAAVSAFHIWETEVDRDRRRRLKGLMRTIVGADLGDDPEVWRDALWRAETGELKIRTAAQRRPGRSRSRRPVPRRAPRRTPTDENVPTPSGE